MMADICDGLYWFRLNEKTKKGEVRGKKIVEFMSPVALLMRGLRITAGREARRRMTREHVSGEVSK